MPQPLVFRFAPGAHGQPEVVYMADLRCECDSCGHPHIQRFYHSTPFHPLTLSELQQLGAEAHEAAEYECEHCGEDVGPGGVRDAALTYGFPDDAGVIRIFVDDPNDEAAMGYELVHRRRLDPQELPGWQPDPERGEVLERVDEFDVEDIFERVFSPKLLWCDIFSDWLEDPDGGAFVRISQSCWIVIDESEEMASELVEEIEDPEFDREFVDGQLVVVPLLDATPESLATHEHPETMPGRWRTWLPEAAQHAIDDGAAWAEAHVVERAAVETMAEAFRQAKLDFQLEETEADTYFFEITTPGEVVYGRGVSLSSVVRRAVYTGITPGESARLTAEEIAGMLLGGWDTPDDQS